MHLTIGEIYTKLTMIIDNVLCRPALSTNQTHQFDVDIWILFQMFSSKHNLIDG